MIYSRSFTNSIDRSWTKWDENRQKFNLCLHAIRDENSIESILNKIIGNLDIYNSIGILRNRNPQVEINNLVKNIEKAFNFLNNYYINLKKVNFDLIFIIIIIVLRPSH